MKPMIFSVLKKVSLLFIIIVALACNKTDHSMPPNVLLIISDDLACALSGYGRRQCKTPNLDKLASRGVQFDRAYTMNPLCGPSRVALLSGLSPWTTGVMNNYHHDREHPDVLREKVNDLVTLPQFFRQHGYYSARVSKIYHMRVPVLDRKYNSDDSLSWDKAIDITAQEQYTPGKKEDLSPAMQLPGVDFIKVEAEGSDTLLPDRMAADKAIGMIQEMGKSRNPFFLAVGFVRPHVPLVAPKRYFEQFPYKEMILAKRTENALDDVPELALKMKNFPRYGMSTKQQKKVLAAYYASISFMDTQVGRLIDALEANGLSDNTIVVFTSDHGYNLGEHECWQKLSLWEDAIRVPLIISAPGKAMKKRCTRIVEHMDLYPTLVELCGFTPPSILQGQSMLPLLDSPDSEEWADKSAYTVTYQGAGESIRTNDWHLNLWSDGKDGIELYNTQNDPEEFTNLAKVPEYADTLAYFIDQLRVQRAKLKQAI